MESRCTWLGKIGAKKERMPEGRIRYKGTRKALIGCSEQKKIPNSEGCLPISLKETQRGEGYIDSQLRGKKKDFQLLSYKEPPKRRDRFPVLP